MTTDDDGRRLALTPDDEQDAADRSSPARYSDQNNTLDAGEDDWAWRRRVRSNPHMHRLYRISVALVGAVVVVAGLIMVPFPGPGWLVVFLGIAIWASEFERAQRLLELGRRTLSSWNEWLRVQRRYVQVLVTALTLGAVLAIFYGLLLLSGVPGFFPDVIEGRLARLPGLG